MNTYCFVVYDKNHKITIYKISGDTIEEAAKKFYWKIYPWAINTVETYSRNEVNRKIFLQYGEIVTVTKYIDLDDE